MARRKEGQPSDPIALAKAEYLTAEKKPSIRKLAEKFGIPENRLEKLASAEKWLELRRKTREEIAEKLPEKLAEVAADEAAKWTADMLRKARELLALVSTDPEELRRKKRKVIAGSKEGPITLDLPWLNDPKDLKALADSLAKADEVGRRALGIPDPNRVRANDKLPETVGPDGQPLTGVIALPPMEPPPAPPDDEEEEDASE